ncbi:MAG: site-2 protease family protein [Spirochaetaceae bacterium]|jgi:regulator of sigma E protease|nr:site-2 protease family protein [Spirochaetaceae bacterium]
MLFIKIILGLIGLGVVVFVHEAGHFLAARLVGIDVEAFSIGWGKAILKKNIRGVEYRLGLFPIGGYCKMRGENEFREAYENRERAISPVKGTFYWASPWRRIVVSFSGPLFNLIFAVLVLTVIWGVGFEVNTLENRVVLVSDINPGERYPADDAGIVTGDRIVAIDGRNTDNYHDIQEAITPNPEKTLALRVLRDGKMIDLEVRPGLDRATGAGRIGVYFWTDPVIGTVAEGSPAAIAGLQPGDRIRRVNGEDFPYSMALFRIIRDQPPVLSLEFERNGEIRETGIVMSYSEGGATDIGIGYQTIMYHTPSYSPLGALAKGVRETWKTFVISLRSLALLFRGIDLTQAVSGPVRITYMLGDAAAEGFGQSFGAGLGSMAGFLSLISIALCIMNLLPLPVLDGGMILLFFVEILRGHPLNPRAIYAFQAVGVVLIFGLMAFAVFGDILFLVRR